jgi:hypothetical protein
MSRQEKVSFGQRFQSAQHSGTISWRVDLGYVDGLHRERRFFKTKPEAEGCAEQGRIKRQNDGLGAFTGHDLHEKRIIGINVAGHPCFIENFEGQNHVRLGSN